MQEFKESKALITDDLLINRHEVDIFQSSWAPGIFYNL